MLAIKAWNSQNACQIADWEDPDQTASDLRLHYLSRPLGYYM